MANLTLNNEALEKYFDILKNLDKRSKKKLITRLTESLEHKNEVQGIDSLFGKWEDDRDSDDIIKAIRESRIDKKDQSGFE
ncbi:hypothetical protein J0A68_06720 [Algoriphagus sp. H41]|uniref:Antitoxin n=1 Tax=Algoriphagus oliviformis TaxID=2811231 RepID=A0ABS3C4X5_9BACT|nr:hypothetical protein [Algoriphagus oliviformis]MBN7810639.1 hypothetical protein [Algoriphagus oliviformis]